VLAGMPRQSPEAALEVALRAGLDALHRRRPRMLQAALAETVNLARSAALAITAAEAAGNVSRAATAAGLPERTARARIADDSRLQHAVSAARPNNHPGLRKF